MSSSRRGSVLFGLLIVAVGVIWLLNNLGITSIDMGELFSTYWPVLLIIWGIDALTRGSTWSGGEDDRSGGRSSGSNPTGWILLIIGLVILGRNIGLYQLNLSIVWRVLWPVILILVGWSLLRATTSAGSGGVHWAVMSGVEFKNKEWKLQDGSFIAIMGGVDLDLTVADIPEKETVLDLTAIMGGVDVKVPPDLQVECEGTAILGGVNFFGEEGGGIIASRIARYAGGAAEGSRRRLRIRCRTLMGGVEVKS
ncbi:MAG: cell wall-active antibiotics response protein [Firmicutes bacterium]|nr:cell wall-active antibiotics response protein [Bacillota bacterium]